MFRSLLDLSLYRGKVVDNGQCAGFAQIVTPSLPHTSQWRAGRKVRGGDVVPGTVIATFGPDGRYADATDGSSHAAIFIEERPEGLRV